MLKGAAKGKKKEKSMMKKNEVRKKKKKTKWNVKTWALAYKASTEGQTRALLQH